jgi:hypothetical protein
VKYVSLTHSDGHFYTNEVTEEYAVKHRGTQRIVEVEDRVWRAWQRHLDDDATWNTLWNGLSKTRDR